MANIKGRNGVQLTEQQKVGYYLTRLAESRINNESHSEPTYVYKLNEIKIATYNSKKEAGRNIFAKNRMPKIYDCDIINYEGKKIPYQSDINGRMIRCKLTGNISTIGNRDVSHEVEVYELVPQLIPYTKNIKAFPSVMEIDRYFKEKFNQIPAVRGVLSNKVYQSIGYIFTRELITITNASKLIKKRKKEKYKNILVTKLVLTPYKKYDSIGWAQKDLFSIGRGKNEKRMSIQILNDIPNFQEAKKIPFYTDDNGNRWMFIRTGKKTLVWPNASKTADEIQVYKLEEEIIPYSKKQIPFPTEDEIFEKFQIVHSVIGCIKGNIFHSKGLKFKLK